MKEPLDAVSRFFVVYEIAPVGGCDPSPNAFDKAGPRCSMLLTVSSTTCAASLPLRATNSP